MAVTALISDFGLPGTMRDFHSKAPSRAPILSSSSLARFTASSTLRPSGLVCWSAEVYSARAFCRLSASGAYPTSSPAFLSRKVRLTRARVCMSSAFLSGRSRYSVCSGGES